MVSRKAEVASRVFVPRTTASGLDNSGGVMVITAFVGEVRGIRTEPPGSRVLSGQE